MLNRFPEWSQFTEIIWSIKACIGTFGNNCSGGPCKEGYYGFGCLSKCNCLQHQQCDRFKGCTDLTTCKAIKLIENIA